MKKIFFGILFLTLTTFGEPNKNYEKTYTGTLRVTADDLKLISDGERCQITIRSTTGSTLYKLTSNDWGYSIVVPQRTKNYGHIYFTTQSPTSSIELQIRPNTASQALNIHQLAYVNLDKTASITDINGYFSEILPELIFNDSFDSAAIVIDDLKIYNNTNDSSKIASFTFDHKEAINGSSQVQMLDPQDLNLEEILLFNNNQKFECINLESK